MVVATSDVARDLVGHPARREEMVWIAARRRGGWAGYVREIGRLRDLLLFLVLRDVPRSVLADDLGLGWSVLQPFLQMILFSIFFGAIAGIGSGNVPYPVFSIAAVVPWTYFSNVVGIWRRA